MEYVRPYSFLQVLDHLRPRITPNIEHIERNVYSRVTVKNGVTNIFRVEDAQDGNHLRVTVNSTTGEDFSAEMKRLRYLFAVEEDPTSAVAHLSQDSLIGGLMVERPWVRVPRCWDPFETSVRIIIGQQISVAAASTICGRLTTKLGLRLSEVSGLNRAFPSAEVLATADLDGIGLTERRKATIQTFSRSVAEGIIDFYSTQHLEEIEKVWCALPGIGPWTAQIAAMRVLGHDDVMPLSDLGILRSINRLTKSEFDPKQLASRSTIWQPFRSWVAQHLWQAP